VVIHPLRGWKTRAASTLAVTLPDGTLMGIRTVAAGAGAGAGDRAEGQ